MFTGPPMMDEMPFRKKESQDDWVSVVNIESSVDELHDDVTSIERAGQVEEASQSPVTPSIQASDDRSVVVSTQTSEQQDDSPIRNSTILAELLDRKKKNRYVLGWLSSLASPMMTLRVRGIPTRSRDSELVEFYIHQQKLSRFSALIQQMILDGKTTSEDQQITFEVGPPQIVNFLEERADAVALLIRWLYWIDSMDDRREFNLTIEENVVASVLHNLSGVDEMWNMDCMRLPHKHTCHHHEPLVRLWHLARDLRAKRVLLLQHICMTMHWLATKKKIKIIPGQDVVALIWNTIRIPPTHHNDAFKDFDDRPRGRTVPSFDISSEPDAMPGMPPPAPAWTTDAPNLKDCILDIYTDLAPHRMHNLFNAQDGWHPEFTKDLAMRIWYRLKDKERHGDKGVDSLSGVDHRKESIDNTKKERGISSGSGKVDSKIERHESMRTAKVAFLS